MSYQADRDRFIVESTQAGLTLYQTRRLLSLASTLQRLAVAQCNGDWPADNGERKVEPCPQCESLWVRSVLKGTGKLCPYCRAVAKIDQILAAESLLAECAGDPRGYVVKLYTRDSTREDRDSGRARAIYVPGRER